MQSACHGQHAILWQLVIQFREPSSLFVIDRDALVQMDGRAVQRSTRIQILPQCGVAQPQRVNHLRSPERLMPRQMEHPLKPVGPAMIRQVDTGLDDRILE
ncbi:hypothetical protein FEP90_05362 [Burkholderia multivorans]|nr:hypothetical protein [Burkholderia multivorans]MDR8769447.1 hypothetical protein [Burkholderia multivorans]MDR8774586.1 hypothetical protein [Burkholderia multivorans]MDR8792834.1 hypothetical protein [Burkholderia multivorans]MDR8859292.1 hypothetical protein [Burkholderia multivorans]